MSLDIGTVFFGLSAPASYTGLIQPVDALLDGSWVLIDKTESPGQYGIGVNGKATLQRLNEDGSFDPNGDKIKVYHDFGVLVIRHTVVGKMAQRFEPVTKKVGKCRLDEDGVTVPFLKKQPWEKCRVQVRAEDGEWVTVFPPKKFDGPWLLDTSSIEVPDDL